jgi:hypothetical protein
VGREGGEVGRLFGCLEGGMVGGLWGGWGDEGWEVWGRGEEWGREICFDKMDWGES